MRVALDPEMREVREGTGVDMSKSPPTVEDYLRIRIEGLEQLIRDDRCRDCKGRPYHLGGALVCFLCGGTGLEPIVAGLRGAKPLRVSRATLGDASHRRNYWPSIGPRMKQ